MRVLKVRIAEILSRTPARSVALVFEASQRADPLLSEFLGALELEEDGRKIAVEHRLMAKSGGEPALEVPTSLCTLSEGWPVGDWKESRAPQLILTPCSDDTFTIRAGVLFLISGNSSNVSRKPAR